MTSAEATAKPYAVPVPVRVTAAVVERPELSPSYTPTLDDPKVLAGIERGGLKVIDLTDVDSPDPLNHGKFAAVPAIVRSIGRQLRGTIESGERPGAGVFAIDAAGAVLDAPGRLLRTVSGR